MYLCNIDVDTEWQSVSVTSDKGHRAVTPEEKQPSVLEPQRFCTCWMPEESPLVTRLRPLVTATMPTSWGGGEGSLKASF